MSWTLPIKAWLDNLPNDAIKASRDSETSSSTTFTDLDGSPESNLTHPECSMKSGDVGQECGLCKLQEDESRRLRLKNENLTSEIVEANQKIMEANQKINDLLVALILRDRQPEYPRNPATRSEEVSTSKEEERGSDESCSSDGGHGASAGGEGQQRILRLT